jgi:hypothetical protein
LRPTPHAVAGLLELGDGHGLIELSDRTKYFVHQLLTWGVVKETMPGCPPQSDIGPRTKAVRRRHSDGAGTVASDASKHRSRAGTALYGGCV